MNAKRCFSRLGFGVFFILLFGSVLQTMFAIWLSAQLLRAGKTPYAWEIWPLSFLPFYCVAVPVGVLILRSAPAQRGPQSAPGSGRVWALLPVCILLLYAGDFLGRGLVSLLGTSAAGAQTGLGLSGPMLPARLLIQVIVAPLTEELVFRRLLIDRMRVYGEKMAVVASALMFALYHCNLSQLFYAAALGLVFGYLYLRTSRLRYGAALHMCLNLIGSIVVPFLWERSGLAGQGLRGLLAGGAKQAMRSPWGAAWLGCAAALAALSLLGAVLLVPAVRRVEFFEAEQELPKGTRLRTVLGSFGMLLFVLSCLWMTAANLLYAK